MPGELPPGSLPLTGSGVVTFRPSWSGTRPRVMLTLDAWTRTAGLAPDLNSAVIPYIEFEKLQGRLLGLRGDVEFWFRAHPDDSGDPVPDVILNQIYLISATPEARGRVPGESTDRIISYRATFADHRIAWQPPRGGLLFDGRLNPEPLPDGETLFTNQQLANKCLAALGASQNAPASMNGTEPLRDLDWSAEHAPTALQELLEATGHVYCPSLSGPGSIQQPWITGDDPVNIIPAAHADTDQEMPSADARPVEVVLTSAPAAEIETWTDEASTNRPSWKYVAQDPDDFDKWKPLAQIAAVTANGTVAQAWIKQCSATPIVKRDRLLRQMYRCIQLDPVRYPPGKVALLSDAVDVDGAIGPVSITRSHLCVKHAAGSFVALPTVKLDAEQVLSGPNVIVFPHPLCTGGATWQSVPALDGSTVSQAPVIPENDLKPTFSVEAYDAAAGRKKFSAFGYTIATGAVSDLSESGARDRLDGFYPFCAIHAEPSLQIIRVNDTDGTNRTTLETRASSYAEACLGQEAAPARVVTARAFVAIELSGRVSSVQYNLAACMTEMTVDDWQAPVRSLGGQSIPAGETIGSSSGGGVTIGAASSTGRPQQRLLTVQRRRSDAKSKRQGTQKDTKQAATAQAVSPVATNPLSGLFLVEILNPVATGSWGRYSCKWEALIVDIAATGPLTWTHLTRGDGVTSAVANTNGICLVPGESNRTSRYFTGQRGIATRVATAADGRPIFVFITGWVPPVAAGNYRVLQAVSDGAGAFSLGFDHSRYSL
jgi:hypothetical protein